MSSMLLMKTGWTGFLLRRVKLKANEQHAHREPVSVGGYRASVPFILLMDVKPVCALPGWRWKHLELGHLFCEAHLHTVGTL